MSPLGSQDQATGCKACSEWHCKGQQLTTWFDDFFKAVVAIGTLGAGFTFSVIFSGLETLNHTVDTHEVRHFLIIAWLLFVLSVGTASMCAAFFQFFRKELIEGFNKDGTNMAHLASAVASIILQLLIVAAFLMSARAMRKYDEDTGKAAEGIIYTFGIILVGAWAVMAGRHILENRCGKTTSQSLDAPRCAGKVVARTAAEGTAAEGTAAEGACTTDTETV